MGPFSANVITVVSVEPLEPPALSEGAVRVWKITSVPGLAWLSPQWDTEMLLKVRKQVHHSPSNRLKVGQRSLKACSVLFFFINGLLRKSKIGSKVQPQKSDLSARATERRCVNAALKQSVPTS